MNALELHRKIKYENISNVMPSIEKWRWTDAIIRFCGCKDFAGTDVVDEEGGGDVGDVVNRSEICRVSVA